MPTLPNMSLITPTAGGDSGSWDDKINAAFALVDAHDHTSGKGVAVPVAGLDIDDDIAMGGNGLTGVGLVDFTTVAALASGANVLFTSSADGELYWRTTGGTNVKLTSGSSINTSLVGGIGGDYSTVGADLNYSDADKVYTHKIETGTWARSASGPVRIYEYNTSESVYVEHAVAAALASSYTVTWPAAVPGAAALMQVSAAGVMSFSNTTTQEITAADFNHTTAQSVSLPGCMWQDPAEPRTHTELQGAGGGWIGWTLAASANPLTMPLPVKVGDVITGYVIWMNKQQTAGAVTARLYRQNMFSTGAESALGAGSSVAAGGTGYVSLAEISLGVTVESGYQYYIRFTPGNSVAPAADTLYAADMSFTRP
jgi:hypothetical protein